MAQQKYVAVYGRVSDADDAERSSIPYQLREGRAFAEKKWTGVPVMEFSEIGSAATIEKRPEFKRLLAAAREGLLCALVVRDADRISRHTVEYLSTLKDLHAWGVPVATYRDGQVLRTATANDRAMQGFRAVINTYEKEQTTERVIDAIHSMRAEGKWTGGPVPSGYALDKTGPETKLVPSEDAPKIRELFEIAARTGSLGEAHRFARRVGLWKHKQSTSYALRNRVYAGAFHRVDGTWIEGHHEPLIPAGVFEAAQRLRTENFRAKFVPRVYTLEGLVWCTQHHRVMTHCHTKKGKGPDALRIFYYQCPEARDCRTKRINADVLEKWVWEQLEKLANHPTHLQNILDLYERETMQAAPEAVARVAELERRLKIERNKEAAYMAQLDRLFGQGLEAPRSMDQRLHDGAVRTRLLEKDLGEARAAAEPPATIDAELLVRAIRSLFGEERPSPEQQRAVVHSLVERIEIAPKDVHIVIRLNQSGTEAARTGTDLGAGEAFEQRRKWWRKFDAGRTLTLPLNRSREHQTQALGDSQLLKPSDGPTALELAEHYDRIARANNLTTTRALATHLNQPYRTIKSIMRLLKLSPKVKRLIRDASKDPARRRRLTRWALQGLVVVGSPNDQLMGVRKVLSSLKSPCIKRHN